MPQEAPLTKLQRLHDLLKKNSSPETSIAKNVKLYNVLVETSSKQENNFLGSIINHFECVMRYEDTGLQEKARKVIPILDLEIATMTRIRQLHK